MKFKKIAWILAVALVIYFVFQQPDTAAGSVQNLLAFFSKAGDSAVTFFTAVTA